MGHEISSAVRLSYTVSKAKGGQWYAHKAGYPGIPCMIGERSTFGTKNNAFHNVAMRMGLPYKEYMALRRKDGTGGGVEMYDPQKWKVRR